MATLLFKVLALTLKTASKPLASQFERYVMNHPVLRQRVIYLAQVSWGRGMNIVFCLGHKLP